MRNIQVWSITHKNDSSEVMFMFTHPCVFTMANR
jgi:hypothetical protein